MTNSMLKKAMRFSSMLAGGGAAGIVLIASPPVAAQEIDTNGTAESEDPSVIIVTARKAEEDIQDVPIAITTFSGEQFTEAGLTEFTDIAQLTPNFSARPNATVGTLTAQLNMRGLSSAFFTVNTDQAVGIVVNGAPITRGGSLFSNLFDIERVEVLKGPQGTLFGKNTIGGVVSVTTTAPKLGEFEGYTEFTVGNFDRLDAEAVLNIPLGETVAARFGAATTNRDGFGQTSDFAVPGAQFELADDKELFFRGSVLFEPNDTFRLRINADYHEADESTSILRTQRAFVIGPIPLGPPPTPTGVIPITFPSNDPNFYDGDFFGGAIGGGFLTALGAQFPGSIPLIPLDRPDPAPFLEARDFNINATAELDLGGATLTSITSYRDQKQLSGLPFAATSSIFLGSDSQLFAQEVRLNGTAMNGRLTWQGGGFYSDETGLDLDFLPLGGAPVRQAAESKNETFSLFTQNTFDITDSLSLTGGIRWTKEDRSVRDQGPGPINADSSPNFVLGTGTPVVGEGSFDGFSWTVGLDLQATEDLLVYASVSRGFRSGGIDHDAIQAVQLAGLPVDGQPITFESEFVTSYELGLKVDLFDDRLRFNAAAFLSDITDPQVLATVVLQGGGAVTIIQNAGSAEVYGFEAELTAEPIDNLVLGAAVGYLDGEFKDFIVDDPTLGQIDNSGNAFGGRNWTVNLSGRYEFDLGNVRIGSQANYFYAGKEDILSPALAATVPAGLASLPSYSTLNAQIDVDFPLGGTDTNVALFATNLFDKDHFVAQAAFAGGLIINRTVGSPRTYGLRITNKF